MSYISVIKIKGIQLRLTELFFLPISNLIEYWVKGDGRLLPYQVALMFSLTSGICKLVYFTSGPLKGLYVSSFKILIKRYLQMC